MQPHAKPLSNPREPSERARTRALVRFNSLSFHGIVCASLLEFAVAPQAGRLAQRFAAFPDVRLWLEESWWPRRAELSRQWRTYLEATWPEFDWVSACEEFQMACRARAGARHCASPALEALALCAAAAQAALFYRTLARCADEPGLRDLAQKAAAAHAEHFESFRALFDRCRRLGGAGWLAAWRTVGGVCEAARDADVPAAFHTIERNWSGPAIVPPLTYAQFREKMARLVLRHAKLGLAQRMLFRAWLRAAAVPVAAAAAAPRALQLAQQGA